MGELEALKPEQIAEAARELSSTAILLGPEGSSAPPGGFCPFTTREPAPVGGSHRMGRARPDGGPPDSVTLDDGGSIVLYAREGTWMAISSLDFTGGEALLAEIRSRIADVQIPCADADVA